MRRRAVFLLVRGLLLASVLAFVCSGGCGSGTAFTSSTWVRSTDLGTEVLLIGSTRPAAATAADASSGLPFARAFVAHDGSTTLDVGTYELDANGAGTFTYGVRYVYEYEPSVAIFDRTGATQTDVNPPTVESLSIVEDAASLLVTLNGTQHRYTNLGRLVTSIDPSTAAGATAMFRLYNLPLALSQSRIPSFGSANLTTYFVAPGDFQGLVAGSFHATVKSYVEPDFTIRYEHVQELTGVEVDGDQVTHTFYSTAPTNMGGTLSWRMTDPATNRVVSGSCDYSSLAVGNGYAAAGYFGFTIHGHGTTQLDYTLASNLDLRDVLPVVAP